MARLSLEAVLELTDRISEPLRRITGASEQVSEALNEQQQALRNLNRQQSQINNFRLLNNELGQTRTALQQAQQQAQRLAQTYAQTANPTRAMTRELEQARNAVRQLQQEERLQVSHMNNLRRALREAGINTQSLSQAERELRANIERGNAELQRRQQRLQQIRQAQERYQQAQERIAQLRDFSGNMALHAGVASASMVVPMKMAMDFESSMADVKKVVDFDTPQQFKQMEQDIIGLSKRLPMTANDIARIMSAGGQSGIAKNELLAFSESAIKMGVAFDITADEAGQAMAEMRTAFKMSQPEVVALADKINWLGNNSPNEAKKVMEVVQRIGSLGEVGGFASSSIAAMAASLTAVEPDVAATGIKNMILALTKGESATKSQIEAFQQLGLDHKKIAKDMQIDANATVAQVMTAIGKMDKDKRVAITNEIFGSEALPIVAQYAENLGTLQKNLQAVSDKSQYAGSMEAEYASRAATTANNLQLLKNRLSAVAMTAGATLLPALNNIMGKIGAVADKIHAWANANPALASTLVKIGAGLVVLLGALSAGALALTAFIGPVALLRVTLASLNIGGAGASIMAFVSKIGTAFTWLMGIVRGVAMFFMANPILIAIGLIATAVYLIYRNWGQIAPFFMNLWNRVKAGAMALWQSLKSGFASAMQAIIAIISAFSPVGIFIRAFSAVKSYLAGLGAQFASYGRNLMQGLANGITQSAGQALSKAIAVANSIKSSVKSAFGINSPSKVFHQYGVWNMQGLAQGIDKMAHLPQNSVMDASQNMLTAMNTGTIKWQHGSALQPKMANAVASQPTMQTFNIYASEGMNEQELARLVALEVAKITRMNEASQRRSYGDYV